MGRSNLFDHLRRSLRTAFHADRENISSTEALSREEAARAYSRRDVLAAAGRVAVIGAAGSILGSSGCLPEAEGQGSSQSLSSTAQIAIVGAGMAGLGCAYTLRGKGVTSTVYEANRRVGGRQFSLGGAFAGPTEFPGQVVERGGELIDNPHKTIIGWARTFGLKLENYLRNEGETFYFFDGVRHPEATVVDEFRDLVAAMHDDLRTVGSPTAEVHTDADAVLDHMNLREYLLTRGASPVIRQAIEAAYIAEFGLEIEEQSALGFLLFVHTDRRSRFLPFGIFSDERYHVVGGNQQIAEGLATRLPDQLRLGHELQAVRKTPGGRIELSFQTDDGPVTRGFDAVVLALPFSVLRNVDLDDSLDLPPWKRLAIDELRYGTNAKMMVGFDGRPWASLGSNGGSYSLLPNHQTTWETNWTGATPTRAVLTDYSGGTRGAGLDPAHADAACERWLSDLDRVFPGARAVASRDAKGRPRVHLEHWPSNPLTLGSYTANHPGYFTTIADLEGKPVGNLFFAGEHTSSFYEWQGFMEGGALSGVRAASEILAAMKKK